MKNSAAFNSDDALPTKKEVILKDFILRFDSQFPTEVACRKQLLRHCYPEPISCKDCDSQNMESDANLRVARCKCCRKERWMTAGTFFERIRSSRPWLLAIRLIGEGIHFNAADLHRLAGVAPSTANQILKKIAVVIDSSVQSEAEAVAVPSALYLAVICKRSLETPANEHPISEQAEMEKRCSDGDEGARSVAQSGSASVAMAGIAPNSSLGGPEQALYALLSVQPIHFEDLCEQLNLSAGMVSSMLISMELEGLIEQLPGDRYIRSIPYAIASCKQATAQASSIQGMTNETLKRVAVSVEFIRDDFRGISRKYLQLYLSAQWCHIDRVRWSFESLLEACSRFRYVGYREILAFVSPLKVKLPPC